MESEELRYIRIYCSYCRRDETLELSKTRFPCDKISVETLRHLGLLKKWYNAYDINCDKDAIYCSLDCWANSKIYDCLCGIDKKRRDQLKCLLRACENKLKETEERIERELKIKEILEKESKEE